MIVPKELWNLLVPSASCGGRPEASNAGTVMSPPPPAMASMKPPAKPARKRRARVRGGMVPGMERMAEEGRRNGPREKPKWGGIGTIRRILDGMLDSRRY